MSESQDYVLVADESAEGLSAQMSEGEDVLVAGGSAGGQSAQIDTLTPLERARKKRSVTKRQMAALASDVRREFLSRKREAHLERMLLPDAPPRKHQTKKKSPERQPCVMYAPGESHAEPDPLSVPTTSSSVSSVAGSVEGAPEPVASTSSAASSVPRSVEPLPEPVASTSIWVPLSAEHWCPKEEPSEAPMEDEYVRDALEIGAELVQSPEPSPMGPPSAKGASSNKFDTVLADWLHLTDQNSDDDVDMYTDDDLCLSNLNHDLTEPATTADMTFLQVEVLLREDQANDSALRDIVSDPDCYTFGWSKDRTTFQGHRETFTGTSGPTFEVTDQTRPTDIFDKMFDTDFIDLLVTETNRYAEDKVAQLREQNKLSSHSRLNRWVPTDRDEMISFLAIIILMGLYPLSDEEGYFSFNGYGTLEYFGKIMSYNRYALLKSFLHFVDSKNLTDTTRLCKIRPVVDYFNEKFSTLYLPAQEIAIDESLLKWYGRLTFAQKIASKAAQVGVKTYELCESSSGYLWRFIVYTGKDKTRPDQTEEDGTRPDGTRSDETWSDRSDDRPTNATAKIVYDLVEPLLYRGHTVIMDNFYNSPLLLRSLKRQQTDCYGTLRLNREFVPDSVKTLKKTDLRQGEVVATYCSDLSILVWRDSNIVSLISTYHNLQIGTQDKYNRLTYKPTIVLDYNKCMGRIDRKDQSLAAHPLERTRTKVWYKKLFRRLYNAALYNCYVIFSSANNVSHRRFRTVLAEDLLKRHRKLDLTTETRRLTVRHRGTGRITSVTRPTTRRTRTQARPKLDHNHFPARTGSKYTVCFLCPRKTRTSYKCEECDVNLCIGGCFKAYHK